MSDRLYFPVPDECDNMLAQRFLRDKCGLSARIITRLKREKDGILIDGKILRTIDCVQSGKTVSIAIPDEKCKIEPTKGKLDIRYEDDHFLVVNKPHSMPVHPVKQHQSDTLATSLKLNASEIVLYIGQSFDINSSVQKGTAAYYRLYSSSNSKIAAVTRGGGVVKGVATGKATVTCTLNNGKKAICNVYIMPQSKKISNVPLIGQSKLPTGCETCSATMLLNFYGYKISETTFADKYLVKKPFGYSNGSYTGPDPNCAFVGTPYSSNSYGAYAPIMAKCMNKYLSDKSYKAVEISGKSLEYLSGKYVAQGQPIMVWATINMSPSFKTTTWRVNYTDENAKYKLGSYYTWTAGEHCLLLTGYDKDYYYFNDPWTNARTRYSKSLVNTRYNELGKQAVVMVKK